MNRLIDWFARNSIAANLLMMLFILGGGLAATTIVQENFPEFSLDAVEVRVRYPGASPEDVEDSIIQRIEDQVKAVEGIDRILATAAENVGVVTVELYRGTDLGRVRTDIKSEVDRITAFPDEAEEPIVTEVTNREQVLQVALHGDIPLQVLRKATQQAENDLTLKPEISYVQMDGVPDEEISIELSRNTLRAYELTLSEVSRRVRESSLDLPGGSIETEDEEISIRTEGQNYVQSDFEDIILLSQSDGTSVRLGDLATVRDGFDQNSDLITRFNGEPAVLLNVFRTGDEQALDVEETVKSYLNTELRPELPPGITATVWRNSADNLRTRLNIMIENGLVGLVLVILMLTLFLTPRKAFWTASGIFLSFLGALILMQLLDVSINMLSVFGFIIAMGIAVDDAIVVVENVYAEQRRTGEPLSAAIEGTQRVATPVVFAVLTTIAAFAPLLFVGGTIGKFLGDVPTVVIFILAMSVLEVLFILPSHLSHSAGQKPPKTSIGQALNRVRMRVDRWLTNFIEGPLQNALNFATRHYGIAISGGLGLLIITFSLLAGGYIKNEFFPSIPGNVVTVQVKMPPGTNAAATERAAQRLRTQGVEVLRELEDESGERLLETSYTTVGRQPVASGGRTQAGFTAQRPNVAEVSIEMVDAEERTVPSPELEDRWRRAVGTPADIESLAFVSSTGGPGGDPVSVQLFAPTVEQMKQAAMVVQDSLQRRGGVVNVTTDWEEKREIKLRLKPAARTLGLTLNDLAQQTRAAFFGVESYRLQRGQDEVRVYVRLPDEERNAVDDLHAYRIRTPSGDAVPLDEVATVSLGTSPTQIQRQDGRRVVTVSADVDATIITGGEASAQLEQGALAALQAQMPDLSYQFGGQQREQNKSQGTLQVGFLLALFAIYGLLAIPFRSYVQPLIIMATIPFAWIGALLGHFVLGYNLIMPSIFGIVGLSGVIVNNALVMLDFANEARAKGASWQDALIQAGQVRFRPIFLTSLTTFFGLVPFILERSVEAQFLVPMAISLGGGILAGTVILMFIVPALAMLQHDATRWIRTTLSSRMFSGASK
ncbi:MAG: efflux RND transporter permease subunit [Longimonas sp.]|uniref:efflux RND transporter permease subunit n=1 Tax=Longimonas sp. TaxID=2039626 RepID=UPI003976F3F6